MKRILLFFTLLLAFLPKFSGQTWQIGAGTATSSNLPIYSCYGYNYSQQLYKASELTTALATNTTITKIKFFVSATADPQSNYNQWVVYMGNTTKTAFSSNTDWVPLAQMTSVYSGTLPNMTAGTWVEIPLSTPFVWNGTDNLVIAVDENAASWSCTGTWGAYTSTANSGIYYYSDGTNPNPASPPSASSRVGSIPRLQFDGSVPSSCPYPTGITVGSIAANSAQVSWTAPTPAPPNGYDVYYNTTGTPPTAGTVLNATNSVQSATTNATITGLAGSTTYYVWVRAKCASGQSIWMPSYSFTTLCTAITVLPWTENFDAMTGLGTAVLPPCWRNVTGTSAWASSNAAASSSSPGPRSTPNYVRIQYGNTNASQLWTPGFALTAGVTYEYSFYYHTGGTGSSYTGYTGNVLVNTSQSSTGATNLGGFITASQGTNSYTQHKVYFTPTTTATYNFAVNVSSTSAPWYLGLDDFRLRVAPTCLDPQGFSVVSTTTTSTTVQWTVPSPAPANGYDVYYTTNPATPPATVTPQYTGVAGPTQLISGLTPSTTYYIWVRAKCSATDIGDWTGPLFVYTNYCLPTGGSSSTTYYLNNINTGTSGFTNITYTANSYNAYVNNSAQSFSVLPGGQVTVNLTASSGTHYFHAWVDWNNNMVFDANESVYTPTGYLSTVSFPISSVGRPSGSYRVRFASNWLGAVTPCGPAAYGNYVDYTFVIRPCSTVAPTNVTVTNINHISATVNWTPSPDNLSYRVYWREAGLTTWPNSSPILNPPTTTFNITTGLQPAKAYEVKVVAICNAAEGTAPAIPFSTTCDPTPPNVVISNISSTSALATWSPLVASANYEIRWREVGTPGWTTPQTTGGTTPQPPLNSYLIQGLESFKTYEVQVRSICIGASVGNPWSNPQVFTTIRVCSIPPPGLTITQLNPTSAEVTWDAYTGTGATNSYILRYRKVGIPSWTTINVNNTNTYTINGLLELTKYEMQVANVCTGTPGNFTPLYYFTTPTVTYCPMAPTVTGGPDYINKVTVTPYQGTAYVNSSVNTNYFYYPTNIDGKEIVLVQGSQGNVVKIDKTSSSNTGVAVWIDFNRNGIFDVNEKILSNGPNSADNASAAFTVPDDAFVSLTDYKYVTMRVAMQKDGVPVNCTSFQNGEVEDYRVRIVKQAVINPLNQTDIMIYPNPVSTILNVKNISKKANYKIYSAAGQLVSDGLILNNKIDVTRLINGLYVIELVDGDKTVQKKFIKE